MNIETAKRLCKINTDFYHCQSSSFSQTRKAAWKGWERVVGLLKNEVSEEDPERFSRFSLFDLACGNLRFETFLRRALPDEDITCYAVDNCDDLVASSVVEGQGSTGSLSLHYQNLDVVNMLLEGRPLRECLDIPACDLSVSFGFMHHIPSHELRENLLSDLIGQTTSGGYVAVSFWQFLTNEALAEKARVTHEQALAQTGISDLDENDYLLGWKNTPGVYRYCHSFSESDIDRLTASCSGRADVVARFVSDGRTNDLNTYVILKVR